MFDAASTVNPFASAEWTAHFIEQVIPPDSELLVAEVAGRALWLLQRTARRESTALANYYTSLYSPITGSPQARVESADALILQLREARPRISALRLWPLESGAPDTEALASVLRSHGWYVEPYFCFGNWSLSCAGLSGEDYLPSLPSQTRNALARKGRKFRASGGTLAIYTSPADVASAKGL